ncbi:MAG: hypothetical protein U0Q18_25485 [Bryobacteraceae bacterium]
MNTKRRLAFTLALLVAAVLAAPLISHHLALPHGPTFPPNPWEARASSPTLTGCSPATVTTPHASYLMTCSGTGLVFGDVLYWNSTALVTNSVSPGGTSITSTVPSSLVQSVYSVGITLHDTNGGIEPNEPVVIILK